VILTTKNKNKNHRNNIIYMGGERERSMGSCRKIQGNRRERW
jgi:hypothetical protein